MLRKLLADWAWTWKMCALWVKCAKIAHLKSLLIFHFHSRYARANRTAKQSLLCDAIFRLFKLREKKATIQGSSFFLFQINSRKCKKFSGSNAWAEQRVLTCYYWLIAELCLFPVRLSFHLITCFYLYSVGIWFWSIWCWSICSTQDNL